VDESVIPQQVPPSRYNIAFILRVEFSHAGLFLRLFHHENGRRCFSETKADFQWTTWHYITEDSKGKGKAIAVRGHEDP
jgi:hypothetical protein